MCEVDTVNALLRLQQTLDAASKYLDENRNWADQVRQNLGIQHAAPARSVIDTTQNRAGRVQAE